LILFFLFFFFQAEDGIRDFHVTGVQTCALPISYNSLLKEKAIRSFMEFSSNFLRMFFLCVSTVKTLMLRMEAICLAVFPCFIKAIISFSREEIGRAHV